MLKLLMLLQLQLSVFRRLSMMLQFADVAAVAFISHVTLVNNATFALVNVAAVEVENVAAVEVFSLSVAAVAVNNAVAVALIID